MEEHKTRHLNDFLEWSDIGLEDYIELVKDCEIRLRNFYSEIIGLTCNDFVKMILIDSAFIIMVLMKHSLKEFRGEKNPILVKRRMIGDGHEQLSMILLTHKFFSDTFGSWVAKHILEKHDFSKIEHMVDFLRLCQQPPKLKNRKKLKKLTMPSVAELHRAGVLFELGSGKKLLNIKFQQAILEIPSLQIDNNTGILLRNMQAFEQCLWNHHICVSDNIALVSMLAKGPKDVEILARNGIIDNWLVKSEGVSTLFQKLAQENLLFHDDFYFSALVEDLNAYCKNPWNKWKATLKQDYFNTPWTIISVIAAGILLMLTIVQSVCSTLQLVL
ncbi:putative UPF0481 protein At3g02645 [Hevea brasiliensis]|uniref:putative UPF0481 protein At3g02645 n=1 Tax=Hevea brasiliensis TaxID=3981 RepID=UPI0025EF289D|nr:putative UPF0481 protein At3g02645 [Hevea brasiliensis]